MTLEQGVEAIAQCILNTLKHCKRMCEESPTEPFAAGYIAGLANALTTVCLFSENDNLRKAVREYINADKAEVGKE